MKLQGIDFTGVAYIAALSLGAYGVYRVVKILPSGATAAQVAASVRTVAGNAVDAITPTNPSNVFNRVFDAAVKAITGRDSLYDAINGAPADRDVTRLRTNNFLNDDEQRMQADEFQRALAASRDSPVAPSLDGAQSPFVGSYEP